jgi:hypothetical protein
VIVTIHQPDFLPWLGFFDRWRNSDLYIVLDDVQFLRRGWHHRDQIKTHAGSAWLTVPVSKKGQYHQLLKDVKIDDETNWRDKHLRTIELNYKKAPNFRRCYEKIKAIYEQNHPFLIDLNMDLLHFIAAELGIATPLKFASDYNVESTSSQRLIDLVKNAGGDQYLTGLGSKDYLDETLFERENIRVTWQQFNHPVYSQLHGEFIPMLSALDYLMMRETH